MSAATKAWLTVALTLATVAIYDLTYQGGWPAPKQLFPGLLLLVAAAIVIERLEIERARKR